MFLYQKKIAYINHYHFVEWPDKGIPSSPEGINTLIDTISINHSYGDWPILVHCSAGVGRT